MNSMTREGKAARPTTLALALAAGLTATGVLAPSMAWSQTQLGGAGDRLSAPPPPPPGVRTVMGDHPPPTPTRLAIEPIVGGGVIIRWSDLSSNERNFEIERFPAFEDGHATVPANTTEFTDNKSFDRVRYRVRAVSTSHSSRWSPWVEHRAASGDAPFLAPGSGFSGAQETPARVGTSEMVGHDAKVIARWTTVPLQTFSGNFRVGVLAFHMNGIDRVEFSVNGGPWQAVREKRLNPDSGVREYVAVLRGNTLPDGRAEVRAIAYPRNAGVPRVLAGDFNFPNARVGEHSMFVYSNARGTLPSPVRYVSPTGNDDAPGTRERPMRTMARAAASIVASNSGVGDGGTVYLLPGEYVKERLYVPTNERWFTIAGAPGQQRSEVTIRDTDLGSPRAPHLRLANFTGIDTTDSAFLSGSGSPNRALWLDNLRLDGASRHMRGGWRSSYTNTVEFATNTDVSRRMEGLKKFTMVRGCSIATIQADSLGDNPLVINTVIRDVFADNSGAHSDVYQWSPSEGVDNHILYHIDARDDISAQGLFAGGGVNAPPLENIAISHVKINNQPAWHRSSRGVFQYSRRINHMVVEDSDFLGPARWRSSLTSNVDIARTNWTNTHAAVDPVTQPGVTYED
ncbi:MAG: hypothetical protein SFZ23_13555 [Planctomycetota bacterium]|nr:hypothetical protein [Planctomycetota bacterium]